MKVKIAKTVYEEINLSEGQIKDIIVKFLEQKISPGEYLREHKGVTSLMQDDPEWRHGSVSEEFVRVATEEDLLIFKFLDYMKALK